MKKDSTKEEISNEIVEGVKGLYSSTKWKEFLDFSSKFNANAHRYSFSNQLLIMLQNPEASYVASYSAFKKMNIAVDKGEKAMWICCAEKGTKAVTYESIKGTTLDTEKVRSTIYKNKDDVEMCKIPHTYFNYRRCVFDISQTNGKDKINNLAPKLNYDLNEGQYQKLVDVLKTTTTAEVVFKDKQNDFVLGSGASGYFRPSNNLIIVDNTMSEADKIKTLVHEIAHSNLHGEELKVQGIEDTSLLEGRDMKEIQAESVAYVVCKKLGIDSSTRSFDYIGMYAFKDGDDEKALSKVKDNLSIVIACSNQILDKISENTEKVVQITCYGKTEELPYEEALNKYARCLVGTDGHELNRYVSIVEQLLDGETEISDYDGDIEFGGCDNLGSFVNEHPEIQGIVGDELKKLEAFLNENEDYEIQ